MSPAEPTDIYIAPLPPASPGRGWKAEWSTGNSRASACQAGSLRQERATGQSDRRLLLFGGLDSVDAIWTWSALRSGAAAPEPAAWSAVAATSHQAGVRPVVAAGSFPVRS